MATDGTTTVCGRINQAGKVSIVFGGERTGLSYEELEQCHALVNIPTNPDFSSLNVAAAAQVLCYELHMVALASPDSPIQFETGSDNIAAKHPDDVPAMVIRLTVCTSIYFKCWRM
jgi:tRNA C32,U32 (ribose-2'-O)-methylase TrmJ